MSAIGMSLLMKFWELNVAGYFGEDFANFFVIEIFQDWELLFFGDL